MQFSGHHSVTPTSVLEVSLVGKIKLLVIHVLLSSSAFKYAIHSYLSQRNEKREKKIIIFSYLSLLVHSFPPKAGGGLVQYLKWCLGNVRGNQQNSNTNLFLVLFAVVMIFLPSAG